MVRRLTRRNLEQSAAELIEIVEALPYEEYLATITTETSDPAMLEAIELVRYIREE